MIFDIHTHFFSDRSAGYILRKLSASSGLIPCCDGTFGGTLKQTEAAGVDHFAFLPIAVTPVQQQPLNDFAASLITASPRVVAFGSVHPAAPDLEAELQRIKDLGLKGIKFHPQYQEVYIDDENTERMIRAAWKLKLPLLFHAGFDPGLPAPYYAEPERIARLLDRLTDLPDLVLIAAHLGGLQRWDAVEQHLVGKNIYFDTAMTGGWCDPAQYRRIIMDHGYEKVLMGSDCPWQDPKEAIAYLKALELPHEAEAAVLGGNAARLFDLV